MKLEVLLFGAERAAAGRDRVTVEVEPSATCRDVRDRLGEMIPHLQPHLLAARIAVNGEFVPLTTGLNSTDEIAVIGLVSGG